MFILCRILLVRCDEQSQNVLDNSSVVMFTSKASSSSSYAVDSGDNGANGFQVDHEEQQYLDILKSALNITKLPDIAKVSRLLFEYDFTLLTFFYCGAFFHLLVVMDVFFLRTLSGF